MKTQSQTVNMPEQIFTLVKAIKGVGKRITTVQKELASVKY